MALGKEIRIYLADGTVTGIRLGQVVNWTGQAVACPRKRIGELNQWPEIRRPGVYFLFGYDEESEQLTAYVGEAENVWDRLQHHVVNKEFWNEIILFTNKDANLTKAHAKYLESRLISLSKAAKRYKLENTTAPQEPLLPRADRDSMEHFIEEARDLLGVFGHRVLEPLTSPEVGTPPRVLPGSGKAGRGQDTGSFASTKLVLNVGGLMAEGLLTDEGIVVVAGSQASKVVGDSLSSGYRKLRNKMIRQGVLAEEQTCLRFAKDYLFPSPSPAAAIVAGYAINGRKYWKDTQGKSIATLEEQSSQSSIT
jgi:hypothetical protein